MVNMNQMGLINDNEFTKRYNQYHNDNDAILVCNNNIVTYLGDSKYIVGHYKIEKNTSINLGKVFVSEIDTAVWSLEPHALFFLLSEYSKVLNGNYDFVYLLDYLVSIIKKPNPSPDEINVIISFVDYYNSLTKYKRYLRFQLLNLYEFTTTYIKDTLTKLGTEPITPGYRYIYERLFTQVVDSEKNKIYEDSNSSKEQGKARTRLNGQKNVNFVPVPSDLSLTEFFTDPTSKAAFSNLLMIGFIIIATIAIICTLIFL